MSSWGAEHYSASHLSRAASVSADIRRAAVTARGYERMSGTAALGSTAPRPRYSLHVSSGHYSDFPTLALISTFPFPCDLSAFTRSALCYCFGKSFYFLHWSCVLWHYFYALHSLKVEAIILLTADASDGLETRDNLRGTSALTHLPHRL